ncbi:hypothetical protein [Lacticaseibacillus brantae]|uniref:DUF2187 domain-containing protein n=1 Tax=Lacticaseibacillus brantae DSM 23927 TaxID=1423727 RepID=A0A0R2AW26_9LACO|nr:hypothetical protein [Lacticaseibacillus brantae]KRM71453.1 hypothetical protein FC34_GL001565 [Lacticaseibacillus brantae DSM 23927]
MAVIVNVGDSVTVKKGTDVPLSFKGTIEKLYVNSALLTIDDFDQADATLVDDLKNKTVVNYKSMKKGGKAVEPPAIEDPKR